MAWSEKLVLELLNYLVVLAEIGMLYLTCSGFFKKKRSRSFVLLSTATLTLVIYGIAQFLAEYTVIKAIIVCLIIWIWIMVSFNARIVPSIFVTVFYQAFLYISDTCFILITSFLFDLSQDQMLLSPSAYYLMVSLAKCTEMIGVIILRKWAMRKFTEPEKSWQEWLLSSFAPISTFLIGIFLLRIFRRNPNIATELMCCSFIMLFTNMSAVVLLEKLVERQIMIRNNAILKQSMKKEQENLALWADAYRNQRKQTHDFQNHLTVLRGMLKKSIPNDEILSYIDTLTSEESQTYLQISTRNNIADILINQKYALAQRNDIRFDLQLDDLSCFPLPDDAFTVVLGNLLDNAISACGNVLPKEKRVIKLRIESSGAGGYLYIENPTDQPVRVVDNHAFYDTAAISDHGFGLQNVRTIFEEYHAEYVIDYLPDSSTFVVSAQFFAQSKN